MKNFEDIKKAYREGNSEVCGENDGMSYGAGTTAVGGGNIEIKYPENVKKIIEIYKKYGENAYAVGGCVRDAMLGKQPSDWDITVSATPQKTIEIFSREGMTTIETGIKHGTVSVICGGEIFECTTHRIDGEYKDSRHPEGVVFTRRLEEDLERRDFTINAIAAHPEGGIFDPFGGEDDLKRGVIRCVGEPTQRFSEDALRMLRAVRFATVTGFEIEDKTLYAIRELAHLLENIACERRTEEFRKILISEHADRGISLLFGTGVMKYLLPDAVLGEVKIGEYCVQRGTEEGAIGVKRGTEEDIKRDKSSMSAKKGGLGGGITRVRGEFSVRLACLMHDTGARDTSCLRLSRREREDVRALLCPSDFECTEAGARRLLSMLGGLAHDACDIYGESELGVMVDEQEAAGAVVSLKQLCVSGGDLLEFGIQPSRIGGILKRILAEVIEHPEVNVRGEAVRKMREWGIL